MKTGLREPKVNTNPNRQQIWQGRVKVRFAERSEAERSEKNAAPRLRRMTAAKPMMVYLCTDEGSHFL